MTRKLRSRPCGGRAGRVVVWAALSSAPLLVAAKDVPTTCSDICDTLTSSSCEVTTTHDDIVAGSDIDCTSARTITVDGGTLKIHDGIYALRGKSLTLENGGKLIADCPQSFTNIGFRVVVDETISFVASSGGKMEGRCGVGGGHIALEAGGDVSIDALGIDVNGTQVSGPGGSVSIVSDGDVAILADVTAEATGGIAEGGSIEVEADGDISVQAALKVKGYGNSGNELPGGEISLQAGGDISVTAGSGLNAETAAGGGGEISLEAGGILDVRKPLEARGTSGSEGVGGSIYLVGEQVKLDNNATVIGGHDGGTIQLEARGGGITVGTTGTATTLDATGNTGEEGGEIILRAGGSNVTLGTNATLAVTGAGSGAAGGQVDVSGIDVTTASGTQVFANGASPDQGGAIRVVARGAMDLDGTIQANSGGTVTFVHRDGTPTIDSGITGYDLVEDSTLPGPCGDAIRNAADEDCDGADLAGETCTSQSQGTGDLACASDCTFDTTGCSGS